MTNSTIIVDPKSPMTIVEDPVIALARDLFLKSYSSGSYLTDQNRKHIVSTIENSIEVAQLFYQTLDSKAGQKINEKK